MPNVGKEPPQSCPVINRIQAALRERAEYLEEVRNIDAALRAQRSELYDQCGGKEDELTYVERERDRLERERDDLAEKVSTLMQRVTELERQLAQACRQFS